MKLSERYRSMTVMGRAAIWFMVCNCILSGINFLTMPFLTRLMSTEQYGMVAVYNSWLGLMTVFATLNLSAGSFNNGMVKYDGERDRFSSSMQGLLAVQGAGTLVFVLVLRALGLDVLGMSLPMVCSMFLQIFMTGIFTLFSARQRYEYKYIELVKMTAFYALTTAVCSVIAVALDPVDSTKALVKVASAAIGSSVVGVFVIARTQHRERALFDAEFWRFAYLFSLPLIPHYLALTVLGQIDRIMISQMVSDSAAAIYAVAYTIGTALSIVSSALNSSTVPWQFEKLKRSDLEGLASRLNLLTLLLCAFGFLVVIVSPEIMKIAAPSSYYEAVYVMPPVAASMVFMFLYNILSNYEFYFMANKFIAVASSMAALVNYLLNLFLIPQFGYMGAAYATLACYILLAAAHTIFSRYVCRKHLGEKAPKLFDIGRLWAISLAGTALMLLASLAFPLWQVRGAILVIALGVAVWKKDALRAFLKRE